MDYFLSWLWEIQTKIYHRAEKHKPYGRAEYLYFGALENCIRMAQWRQCTHLCLPLPLGTAENVAMVPASSSPIDIAETVFRMWITSEKHLNNLNYGRNFEAAVSYADRH